MKTYTEIKGNAPFDWNYFLAQAIKKEPSEEERNKVERMAGSWVTCSCGSQCAIIPRDTDGEPFDAKLSEMGGLDGFYGAIRKRDWELAQFWLRRIEQRSVELIQIEVAKAQEILRLAGVE